MNELEAIVQRMIDAGESEDNIKLVIEEYNKKSLEKTQDSQKTDAPVESESTASQSGDTSSDSLQLSEEANEIINSYQSPKKLEQDIADGKITNTEVIKFVDTLKQEAVEPDQVEDKKEEEKKEEAYVPYDDVKDKHDWLTFKDDKGENQIDRGFFNLSDKQAAAQLNEKYPGFEFKDKNHIAWGKFVRNEEGKLKWQYPEKQASGFNVVEITAPNGDTQLIEFNIGTLEFSGPKAAGYNSIDEAYNMAHNNLTSFIDKHSTKDTDKEYLNNRASRIKQYKDFFDKVNVTEDQTNSIVEEFANPDLFKPITETTYTPLYGGKVGSSVHKQTTTTQPYEKELNAKAKELGPNATREEIETAVREQLVREAQQKILKTNTEEVLDTDEFKNFKQNQTYALASKEFQNEYNSKLLLRQQLQNKLTEDPNMQEMVNLRDKFEDPEFNFAINPGEELVQLENGKKVPKRIFDQYQAKHDLLKSEIKDYEDLTADLTSNLNLIESNADQLDLLRRNYNGWQEAGVDLTLGFADLIMGYGYGSQKLTRGLFGVETERDAILDEDYLGWRKFSQKTRDKYKKDVEFDDAFDNWTNFGSFAVQEVVNQIPIFAALATPGGMVAVGTNSFGEQYADMTEQDMLDPNNVTSNREKWWSSLGYGASEVVFGSAPTYVLLRNAKRSLQNTAKNKLFDDGVKKYVKDNLLSKQYAIGVVGEPIGEGLTQFTQNAISGRELLYGVDHAMFSGFMFGKTFATVPVMKGAYLSQFSDAKQKEQIRIFREEQGDLAKLNARIKKGLEIAPDLTGKRSQLISENDNRIEELQELIELEVKKTDDKVKTLSNKAAEGYIGLVTRQEDIRIRAREIKDDASIPNGIKEKKIAELEQEFAIIQNGINEFKKSKTYNSNWHLYKADKKNKIEVDKLMQQAEIELMEQDNISDPDLEQINDRARIIYNTNQIKADIAKTTGRKTTALRNTLVAHDTTKETIDFLTKDYQEKVARVEADENLTPDQLKQIRQNLNNELQANIAEVRDGAHGFMMADANGNLQSVVNVENMAKDDRLETKTHELQHVVFASVIGTNDAAYTEMSDAILDWTNKNNSEVFERINTFTERKADGSLKESEVVAVFMEEVAAGNIDLEQNKGLAGLLGHLLSKNTKEAGDIEIDLAGETDAVRFLVGLANKIKNDQLKLADISAIKRNQIIKGIRKGDVDTQFSKAQYKEMFTPEQLVEIIKAPTTTLTERTFAEEALLDQFDLLALKALNYDTRKGDIRREDVLAEARVFFPSIIERFDPATAKFSTWVTSNMRPKQQQIYEATKRLARESESLDREGARQVQDDTNIEDAIDGIKETTNKPPKTNVLNIGNIRTKNADILKNTKVKEGDNFKQVLDLKNPNGNTGKNAFTLFNVPATKILDRDANGKAISANLTYAKKIINGIPEQSEAGNIQNFFSNKQAVGEFIRILPKENVTEKDADVNKVGENIDVERDIYGNAIGLPNSVLEYFYEPKIVDGKRARSQGKTSQVKLWKLKDKFVNPTAEVIAEVQRDIGITPRGELNQYNRTPIGQLLKGMAKVMAMQVTLSGAQRNLVNQGASPLNISRVTAAQSKLAFSKSVFRVSEPLIQINPEFEGDLRNVDKLLNAHINEGLYKHRTKQEIDEFFDVVENVWIPVLPKGFITKTVIRPSKRVLPGGGKALIDVDGVQMTIDQYYTMKRDALLARTDLKYGKDFDGAAANYKPGRTYAKMFGKTAKEIEAANKNGTIKAVNEVHLEMHRQLWRRIHESIQADPKNARAWGNYLSLVAQDVTHPHRQGAEMIGWTKKPKGHDGKLYEWEHAMPATRAYLYLLDASLSGYDFDTAYDLVADNYKLIALDKADDMKLKSAGRQTSMGRGWTVLDNWFERYFHEEVAKQGGIDPKGIQGLDGKNFDEIYNINVDGKPMFSKPEFNKNMVFSKAVSNFRAYNKGTQARGMSTFDFDETLIIDGENFVTATKDGDVVKIPSDKWPIDGPKYADEGYTFDFSDFVNVRGGKEGPLLQKMRNQIKKYGPKNVFVLTARMQEAAKPIHEWLKAQGINIPLENITGLGNSKGEAKAEWMLQKFSEGYNDMYFVDDALPNVDAVKHVLDQLDIKSKVVQAKINFSKNLDADFNNILERNKGIDASRRFSRVEGRKRGKNKGRFQIFVPPSAEDFVGLLRYFAGKGEQGDADVKFFEDALVKPYARAEREMATQKQRVRDDYKSLLRQFPKVKKKLNKMSNVEGFTNEQAVRVYLFNKAGHDIPGMSQNLIDQLVDVVNSDPDMKAFADNLGFISRQQEGYLKPDEQWDVGNIAMDLQDVTNKVSREQLLQEWIDNKNIIFSEENLNKIEAIYGSDFRSALEDMLYAMETGSNRRKGATKFENQWNNWINNSVGAIMFFNARSAVLQTLSTVNFVNFEDNNIFAAARAFANQKQFWSDFAFLFNSDFLKGRRAGLAVNINEAELASAVAGTANKAKAALQYLLKIGFTPTQIADSFAIAAGGATYYRNRVKRYIKEGMSQESAEKQAMLDFQEIAEETQQSARPDRISQQQRSNLGRIILAFANTPLQYNRLIKKAAGDLVNGRGDWRSNVSRILYYGAMQNFIFASLQNALFALAFDEEGDERKEEVKQTRIINSMLDSLLRGSGIYGAALATIKNTILEFAEQKEKGFRADYNEVVIEALQVSPPLGSKARKLSSAGKTYKWDGDVMQEMSLFDYDNPIWLAAGNVVEATTNIPMARAIRKVDNLREAMNQNNENWQRLFLLNGWSAWDLNVGERVVRNEGKDNEYVVFLDKRKQAVEEAEQAIAKRKKEEKEKKKAKEKEEKKKNQRRCSAIKSDGERCKIMIDKPKTKCHYHD